VIKYKSMATKILESKEYLRNIREAIRKRQISSQEAIWASATSNDRFQKKLSIMLPFSSYIKFGVDLASRNGNKLITPCCSIIKLDDFVNMTKEQIDEIASKPFLHHERLFHICDAVGGISSSRERYETALDNPKEFLNHVPFRMLYWSAGYENHQTPVSKLRNFSEETVSRCRTWQQIHEATEVISAGIMQEKGMIF